MNKCLSDITQQLNSNYLYPPVSNLTFCAPCSDGYKIQIKESLFNSSLFFLVFVHQMKRLREARQEGYERGGICNNEDVEGERNQVKEDGQINCRNCDCVWVS